MKIKEAITQEDFTTCFEVMKELRPHHHLESFLYTIEQMKSEGYHLLYIEEEGKAVCTAGFRYTTTLYDGLIIDFDDLVTSSTAQKKGYAGTMFNHLLSLAKERSIKTIHLNSAHHRYDAHRFYLNKKMKIIAHHFRMEL